MKNPDQNMTNNTRGTLLRSYYEFRSESLPSDDHAKIQKHFDRLVKWNYEPYFTRDHHTVLEIGCYVGYTLNSIKNLGQFDLIEGLEISSSAADQAKKNTGLNTIYCEDAFNFLPRNKGKYDIIIMKAVLEHIPKERTGDLLHMINDSLNLQGIALISVPNMDWIGASHERYMDFTHENGYTPESLHDVMSMYFDRVRVHTMKYEFVEGLSSFIRIKLLQPLAKLMIKTFLTILGQGAYRKTIFERSIIAIGEKDKIQ